ncbi:MAG: hypothetical protein V3U68_02730 [Bacteroidota bacterium]
MIGGSCWVCVLFFLVFMGCAENASFDRLSYFPHVAGTSWTFSGPYGLVVLTDSPGDSFSEFHVDFVGDSRVPRLRETFVVSGDQIYWRDYDLPNLPLIRFDPPLPLLPSSLRVGDSLVVDSNEQWRDSVGTSFAIRSVVTVVGQEDVTVPAGDFEDCIRVRQAILYEDRSVPHLFTWIEFWYAEGIGWVKYDSQAGSGELLSAIIGDNRYP